MRPAYALARPMIAGMFVKGGLDAVRAPGARVAQAAKLGLPAPEVTVRVNGAAMVLGGTALALGVKKRRAALLLAASLVPSTYAGHPFWEAPPETRQMQTMQFLKNLAALGGLLLVATEPTPHHTPRAARKAARRVEKASTRAARKAEKGQAKAEARLSRKAVAAQEKAGAKAAARAAKLAAKASHLEAAALKKAQNVEAKAAVAGGAMAAKHTVKAYGKKAGRGGEAVGRSTKLAAGKAAKAAHDLAA